MTSAPESTDLHRQARPRCDAPVGGPGRRRLVRPAALIATLLIVAGVVNHARSLGWGFVWDDFIHQLVLRGLVEDGGAGLQRWNLYDFGLRPEPGHPLFEAGIVPWWTDADFKARFFRPVTSLTIRLDYWLYGDWAPGYHLTSLALFVVFLVLAFQLYRDLVWHRLSAGHSVIVLWALAFLALEDAHFLPVWWIANRNTLLASVFVVATVLCLHRQRRTGRQLYLVLAVLGFLLGCGSKESGIVAFPLIALYLLLFEPRSQSETARQAILRLLRTRVLWTFALLTAAYLTFFLAAGYGTRSVIYPAPWSVPGEFLARLVVLVPVGLLSLFFGFVADIIPGNPQWAFPAVGAAVVLVPAAGLVLFRVVRLTPLSAFAAGWVVLSLLVEAGGDISDRLWMNASVGSALLIGLFFERLGSLQDLLAARRYPALILAGVLLLLGVIAAVPMTALRSHVFTRLARGDRESILSADIDRSAPPPRDVFLLNSPSPMLALSSACTWRVGHDDPDTRLFPLQMGRRALSWTRNDQRTMTLTSGTSPFLDGRFEQVFRTARTAPRPGTEYQMVAFTATVVAAEPNGIRTVRFRLGKSLDDPSYRFLVWRDGGLARIAPPAIGKTVQLAELQPPSVFAP